MKIAPFYSFALHLLRSSNCKLTIKNSRILIIYTDKMKHNRQNKSLAMIFGLVKNAWDKISWAIDERLKLWLLWFLKWHWQFWWTNSKFQKTCFRSILQYKDGLYIRKWVLSKVNHFGAKMVRINNCMDV